MKILVKKVNGLTVPKQATPKDAAYDIVTTTPPNITGDYIKIHRPDETRIYSRVPYIEYGTNLYIAPQPEFTAIGQRIDFHTMLFGRSSLSKYNLVLANSVATIDNEYRGQIFVRFKYIFQPEDLVIVPEAGIQKIYGFINNEHIYQLGDKICQMKACANIPIDFELVDNLDDTQRGEGGFGSTGK